MDRFTLIITKFVKGWGDLRSVTTGTIVFAARKIITMNPSRPVVTHVAVRDGRIVATGTAEELCVADAQLDTRFADVQKLLDAQATDNGFKLYTELTQAEIKPKRTETDAFVRRFIARGAPDLEQLRF